MKHQLQLRPLPKKTIRLLYSWDEYLSDFREIASILKSYKFQLKNIYAIPRGGLIFGTMLSYELNLPLIFQKERIGKNTLVVDDISDSGKTLNKLLKGKKFANVATLWYSKKSKFSPEFICRIKEKHEWVVMPWEDIKSSKYDKTKI